MPSVIEPTTITGTLATTNWTDVAELASSTAIYVTGLDITCTSVAGSLSFRIGTSGGERVIPATTDGNATYSLPMQGAQKIVFTDAVARKLQLKASAAPMTYAITYMKHSQ